MSAVIPFEACSLDTATRVGVKIGDAAFDGVLVTTTAPERYDYRHSVIPIAETEEDGGQVRLVLVRADFVDTQIARYLSGFFGAFPTNVLEPADVAERLMARLWPAAA